MVKIRLRRVGASKRPMYRIVAADSRSPRDGRFIEILGHYNPLTEPTTIVVKEDRVKHWLEHGAQPTEVVTRLLEMVRAGKAGTGGTTSRIKQQVEEQAPPPPPAARPTRRRRATAEEAPAPSAPATEPEASTTIEDAPAAQGGEQPTGEA